MLVRLLVKDVLKVVFQALVEESLGLNADSQDVFIA